MSRRMTRGHGWSLAFTMWRTCTTYPLPTFTGAFNLSPFFLKGLRAFAQSRLSVGLDLVQTIKQNELYNRNPKSQDLCQGVARRPFERDGVQRRECGNVVPSVYFCLAFLLHFPPNFGGRHYVTT